MINPRLFIQRKIIDFIVERTYEYAVEKMEERGFERKDVKRIGRDIIFEIDQEEKTGMEVEWLKTDSLEEYVDKYIDAEVDQPKYKYDETFETYDTDMWELYLPELR